MNSRGAHSSAKGGPLRRAWIAAWIVTFAMGGTTMAFQVYHSVTLGHMPWELAVLYGVVPLLIAILVLEIVAEWEQAPLPAKAAAGLIMAGAMFLSASATGAVVLHAAPPHFSLLFGALLDAAELLAAFFILNGPRAADATAQAAASAAAEAEREAAHQAALGAEREARETAEAALAPLADELETARKELGEAVARAGELSAKLDAQRSRNSRAKKRANSGRNRDANSRATEVPDDVDARAEALAILAAEPGISGAKLGERVGKSARWGQLLKNELATSPTDPMNGS